MSRGDYWTRIDRMAPVLFWYITPAYIAGWPRRQTVIFSSIIMKLLLLSWMLAGLQASESPNKESLSNSHVHGDVNSTDRLTLNHRSRWMSR